MAHCVLFCRESQEGEHKHLDMFEITPQGFLPNHEGQEQKKNFLAWRHAVAQASIACETLCKTSCGLAWDQSQIWTPVLQNPRHRWFCTSGKAEVAHHTCQEAQSYHALPYLSTAAPSPEVSQYSSVPFFMAAGYKVISETTQIQCLNPQTTIMIIIDFQSKAANRSTTHWMLLEGEVTLWKSTDFP